MADLEFEPAIPFLAAECGTRMRGGAHCLPQFGSRDAGCSSMREMISDEMFGGYGCGCRRNERLKICRTDYQVKWRTRPEKEIKCLYAATQNWENKWRNQCAVARDPEPAVVRSANSVCGGTSKMFGTIIVHPEHMLSRMGRNHCLLSRRIGIQGIPREQLVHLLSYTNLPTVSVAFNQLERTLL